MFTVPFHHWSPMRKNKLIHYRLNDLTKGKSIGNRWMNPEGKKDEKTLREQEAAFWFKVKVKNRLNIQSDGCCCSVISKPSLLPLNLIFIKTKEEKKKHCLLSLNRIFCIERCVRRFFFSSPGTPVDIATKEFRFNVFFFFHWTAVDDTTKMWSCASVHVTNMLGLIWPKHLQVYPIGSTYQWILKFFMAPVSLHHIYLLHYQSARLMFLRCSPCSFGLIKYVLKLKKKKKGIRLRMRLKIVESVALDSHHAKKIVVFIIKRLRSHQNLWCIVVEATLFVSFSRTITKYTIWFWCFFFFLQLWPNRLARLTLNVMHEPNNEWLFNQLISKTIWLVVLLARGWFPLIHSRCAYRLLSSSSSSSVALLW